jgi:serine/threonine protein kinase
LFKIKYKFSSVELGKGKFSTVILGTCNKTNKSIAIKIKGKNRFSNASEVNILKALVNCPGVITFLDYFPVCNYLEYIICKRFGQMNLCTFVQRNGSLSEHHALHIFKQILNTIIYCSEKFIFHKAIKCSNILINTDNLQVKLCGFGSATLFRTGIFETQINCSDLYLPPEWFRFKQYSAESLIAWQFGILLFNLLYSKMPFLSVYEINFLPVFLLDSKHLSIDSKLFIGWCLTKDTTRRIKLIECTHHPWITKLYI